MALLDLISKGKIGDKTEFSFDLIVDLVYSGLVNNCFNKKEDVDFDFEAVAVWVDDADFSDLMKVFETFQSSYVLEGGSKESAGKK
ncbi:MAG: hypothetical protein J7577_00885 [Sphingobacteriaceae bacterium]|nr:hypothetical protein [Sphingobacteriaceae bacterium]